MLGVLSVLGGYSQSLPRGLLHLQASKGALDPSHALNFSEVPFYSQPEKNSAFKGLMSLG